MRLLSTWNWEMKEFISDDQVPPYAILSHTWDEEEVNFQQWENREFSNVRHMKGYSKIRKFGEQAAIHGFDWVWADTCCIDKKSSAELVEAINAMFRWYRNAAVCYVYLSDATWSADAATINERLRKCRWFTRGWTLQELIAPCNMEFYSTDWRKIATKGDLSGLLSSITGIDEHILKGAMLADVSVARRMSWASRRKTTRTEDAAYCLLGIFDVNLPLIYGEGLKAFRRLQEAIMNTTHDQSLFAWGAIVDHPSELISREQELGLKSIPWKSPQEREPLLGLFAKSPEDFDTSSEISPVDHGYAHHLNRQRPPTVVNGGALIDLVILQTIASASYWDRPAAVQLQKLELAVLLCRVRNAKSQLVALVLHPWGDGYYSRTKELVLVDVAVSHCRFQSWTRTRHVMPRRPCPLRNGDILLRRWTSSFKYIGAKRPSTKSGPAWRHKWDNRVLRLEDDAAGDEPISIFFEMHRGEGVTITLKRDSKTMKPMGSLLIGASLFEIAGRVLDGGVEMPNWIPKHGAPSRHSAFSHVMKIPSDTWELEDEDMPRIYAKVDRMVLGEESGTIDVIDFHMYPNRHSQGHLQNSDLLGELYNSGIRLQYYGD